jgi:hypothetical protein
VIHDRPPFCQLPNILRHHGLCAPSWAPGFGVGLALGFELSLDVVQPVA